MMYTLSGKSGSVKLGFSVNGAACVVALTHQRCWSPLSQKMGEGFWIRVAVDAGLLVFAGQPLPETLRDLSLLHEGISIYTTLSQ